MSKRRGRCIRIADMHINGLWYGNCRFNLTQSVCMVGLNEWCAMIERERRVLI
jgi:hypothetical protein